MRRLAFGPDDYNSFYATILFIGSYDNVTLPYPGVSRTNIPRENASFVTQMCQFCNRIVIVNTEVNGGANYVT